MAYAKVKQATGKSCLAVGVMDIKWEVFLMVSFRNIYRWLAVSHTVLEARDMRLNQMDASLLPTILCEDRKLMGELRYNLS